MAKTTNPKLAAVCPNCGHPLTLDPKLIKPGHIVGSITGKRKARTRAQASRPGVSWTSGLDNYFDRNEQPPTKSYPERTVATLTAPTVSGQFPSN